MRSIRVYLDQADWSYLQDGMAPEAEARLRDAGSRGRATYFISWTHFAENSQLTEGLASRLSFLRSFPGVQRVEVPAQTLVSYHAQVLVDVAEGRPQRPPAFQATPLNAVSETQLLEDTQGAISLHKLHSMTMDARLTSRAADVGMNRPGFSGDSVI